MYTIQRFSELASTNDTCKHNYAMLSDQSVILAEHQTKGRGRFERTWESNEDLTFSILYKQNTVCIGRGEGIVCYHHNRCIVFDIQALHGIQQHAA